jgi:hypothetical protein
MDSMSITPSLACAVCSAGRTCGSAAPTVRWRPTRTREGTEAAESTIVSLVLIRVYWAEYYRWSRIWGWPPWPHGPCAAALLAPPWAGPVYTEYTHERLALYDGTCTHLLLNRRYVPSTSIVSHVRLIYCREGNALMCASSAAGKGTRIMGFVTTSTT